MSSGSAPSPEPNAGDPAPESVLGHLEFAERALQMIATVRQDIVICSFDLDRRIYGGDALVGSLRRFLLEHRRGRLRVLVHQPRLAVRGAHRLVELSRALSSRIEMRQPGDGRIGSEEYIIVDQRKLLLRGDAGDLEARFYEDAPALAREQQRGFEQAWQYAQVAREFSELRL